MTTPTRSTRLLIAGFAGLVLLAAVLAGLLWLDLSHQGLVWQVFRSQTGEETPIGQIRGMVELGGNLIRPQPQTEPTVPIQHTDVMPYGINTFLHMEVEEAKLLTKLEMLQEAGFVWLREEFPWEDLEVDGRGQFTDTRNDLDGDGEPDTISAWLKYDRLVDAVEAHDLRLMVRLSNPPAWSRAENPTTPGGAVAPPDDLQDFVNYAVAVAERYRGRITHYQVWNEPNIYPEWGENFADPAAYTDMLCRTYDALKAVDPDIVVLSAPIAPTISLDGYFGYQDLIYLQNMYDNGAADCFDVLSAQGYGLFSGPQDRRMRLTSVNFARHVYYRDLMVVNGDAHKPVWLSEAAWNPVLDADLPPEQIADYSRYGESTEEQAARWMPEAYQRAAQEWPWIGNIAYWFFSRRDDSEVDQSFYYFRMVEPDYSPEKPTFTPLPVYHSMREYIQTQRDDPVLYRGRHQAQSWELDLPESAQRVMRDGAEFETVIRTDRAGFSVQGTDVLLRLVTAQALVITCDGLPDKTVMPSEDWQMIRLYSESLPVQRACAVSLADSASPDSGDATFDLDSVTVLDRTLTIWLPTVALVVVLGIFMELVLMLALWRRSRRNRPLD